MSEVPLYGVGPRRREAPGKFTDESSGFRVQGLGCGVQGSGSWVHDAWYAWQGSGSGVHDAWFGFQGPGSRVQVVRKGLIFFCLDVLSDFC